MRVYLIFLLLVMVSFSLLGQDEVKDGKYYLEKGHDAEHGGDFETAEKYYFQARDIGLEEENWDGYIEALNLLTESYWGQDKLEEYELNAKRAYDESKEKQLKNNQNRLDAIMNYAYFLSEVKADNKKAIEIYREIFTEKEINNDSGKAVYYNDIGYLLAMQGDYTSALPYLDRALAVYENNNASNVERYIPASTKAICFQKKKEYAAAEKYFLEAHEIIYSENMETDDLPYLKGIYIYLIELYLETKETEKALTYLDELKLLQTEKLQLAKVLGFESRIFLQQEKYNESEAAILEAIRIVQSHNSPKRLADLYLYLAKIYQTKGNPAKALGSANEGIWKLVKKQPTGKFNKNDLPTTEKELLSEKSMLKLLSLKSELLIQENKLEGLKEALNIYDYAFFIQKKYQQQILNDRSKIFQNQEISTLYEVAIKLCSKLFQKTKNEIYVEKAFNYIESSKSSVLLEEIKRKEAEGFSNIDEHKLNTRYDLIGKRKYIEQIISSKVAAEKEKWNAELVNVQNEIIKIDDEIKNKNPNFISNSEDYELENMKSVRKGVLGNGNSAILSYFLTDSFVYAIYIDKITSKFEEIPLDDLERDIKQLLNLRQYTTKKQQEEYNHLAQSICNKILMRFFIPTQIKHLIVIPDKILYYLPFEMLQVDDGAFILEKYNTTYTYSATILNSSEQRGIEGDSLLAIAPVFSNDSKKITLNSSEREIDNISNYFEVSSLLRKEASKNNFLEESQFYDFLHLSTHAYAKGNEPPFIMFYEDTLFLEEIYAQRFNAKMIVLSACETGLGKEEKGEGLMSLSRGFTYAGIPSQVTSLWSINESATKDIIVSFYNYLYKGKNKSEALRRAKIDYLKTAPTNQKSPYYWAGLIQLGDFEPVRIAAFPVEYILYMGIGLLLIGLLIFGIIKKMQLPKELHPKK